MVTWTDFRMARSCAKPSRSRAGNLVRPFKTPLKLANMALVVPSDLGLPLASVERDAILELVRNGRKVTQIGANFFELQDALASGEYDAWHFTGHGAHRTLDPNKAVMLLEKKNQTFTPDNLAGKVRNLGRVRPIVFLNACQSGRSGMSLTGIGGWAREFLNAGAGAFIGTYWSVSDPSACKFAIAVYSRLLAGESVGKAIRGARTAIRDSGNPTWLAYTVFADPMAILDGTQSC